MYTLWKYDHESAIKKVFKISIVKYFKTNQNVFILILVKINYYIAR
jgi:hypothetical protein